MDDYHGESKEKLRRKGRLRKIQKHLTEALTEEHIADEFEVTYKPISEYWSGIFKEKCRIPSRDSPAYGFFLKSKSGEEKPYDIMHLFRRDVDRRVSNKNFDMEYQIPAFKKRIREHIASLQKGKSKKKKEGLESKLPVILLIGALCVGGYFLFSKTNITGNIIANLNVGSSFMNLILVGVLGLVIYFYKK